MPILDLKVGIIKACVSEGNALEVTYRSLEQNLLNLSQFF